MRRIKVTIPTDDAGNIAPAKVLERAFLTLIYLTAHKIKNAEVESVFAAAMDRIKRGDYSNKILYRYEEVQR